MNTGSRRLCVIFSAGPTRYALEAMRVVQIARADAQGALALPPDTELKDLAALLGGDPDPLAAAAITIASTPQVALHVRRIDGVFDVGKAQRWPVLGRLIPHVAPAIGAALEFDHQLLFELDADGSARGLPRQSRAIERLARTAEQALVFTVGNERLGVPLHHVVQVVETGAHFNRAPNAGSFLGAALHRAQVCPVFTVGALGVVLPYVVLFEVNRELFGLTATQVEGVRAGASLDGVVVLDVGRMFS